MMNPFLEFNPGFGWIREIAVWINANPSWKVPLQWLLISLVGANVVTLLDWEIPRLLFALLNGICLGRLCSLAIEFHFAGKMRGNRAAFLMVFWALVQWISAEIIIPVSWGPIQTLGRLLAIPFLGIAVFLALPRNIAKIGLVMLFLFHFLGFYSQTGPVVKRSWLSNIAWIHLYCDYFSFFGFNTKYDFFSPEPPDFSILLWLRLDLSDGTSKWVMVSGENKKSIPLLASREGMLGKNISKNRLDSAYVSFSIEQRNRIAKEMGFPELPSDFWLERRIYGFMEPSSSGMETISSYVRHVVVKHKAEESKLFVKKIKFYYVYRFVISQNEMFEGAHPFDPQFYLPFYLGDFSEKGELINPDDCLVGFALPTVLKSKNDKGDGENSDLFYLHSGLDVSKMVHR